MAAQPVDCVAKIEVQSGMKKLTKLTKLPEEGAWYSDDDILCQSILHERKALNAFTPKPGKNTRIAFIYDLSLDGVDFWGLVIKFSGFPDDIDNGMSLFCLEKSKISFLLAGIYFQCLANRLGVKNVNFEWFDTTPKS